MRDLINWSQPINWNHPITRGLVSWWLAVPGQNGFGTTRWRDMVHRSQNHGTLTNSPTWSNGADRMGDFGAMEFVEGSSQYVSLPTPATVDDFTLAVTFKTTGPNSSYSGVFSTDFTSTNGFGILHYPNTDRGSVYGAIAGAVGNTDIGSSPPNATNDGKWYQAVLTRVASSGAAVLYLNGVQRATGTAATGTITPDSPLRIGRRATAYYSGSVGGGLFWNRALSAPEVLMLHQEMHTGYPSLLSRFFFPRLSVVEAGGGSSVLDADPGSYAITGTDANLEQGYEVPADAGSFSLTGTDAALEQGYEIATDAGSYIITGIDASLYSGNTLITDAGSYSISGVNTSLLVGRQIDTDIGSYAITGTDAAIEQGYEVPCDPGSYSVTGQDASFVEGFGFAADSGSYLVTGVSALLLKQWEVAAAVGTYTVTGTDANLTTDIEAILGGRFVAAQVYHPGFQFAEVFQPGFKSGQVSN
jgi:hypothetical protein